MPKVAQPDGVLAVPSPCFIGVDPGKNGGIAFIQGSMAVSVKMPDTEQEIWEALLLISAPPCFAVIEYINPSFKGTDKGSMAKLYGSYMALRMALTAAKIPFEMAMTAKWARAIGIPPRKETESKTEWKNRLKAKAQQLYPRMTHTLATCDALLIARYCMLKHKGNL